jgi:hypothetical protein
VDFKGSRAAGGQVGGWNGMDGIGRDIVPMLCWHELDKGSFSLLVRKGGQRV